MSGLLPKALAEKNEAKLCQSERGKVHEDNCPIGKLEQVFGQDVGACATDDQNESQVVHEP